MRNSSNSRNASSNNDNDGFVVHLDGNYIGYVVIKGRLSAADHEALKNPDTMSKALANSTLTPFDETDSPEGSILSGL